MDSPRSNKNGTLCTQRPGTHFCALIYKGSGTGTVSEFQRGYLEKGCVHIDVQRVQYLVRAPAASVNTAMRRKAFLFLFFPVIEVS